MKVLNDCSCERHERVWNEALSSVGTATFASAARILTDRHEYNLANEVLRLH